MRGHPFPPVVRWALFPALAGLAGAAGAALASSGVGDLPALRIAAVVGSLSAFAALTSVLTRPAWPSILAALFLGPLGLAGGLALADTIQFGRSSGVFAELKRLLSMPEPLGLICLVCAAHAAGHRFALRRAWTLGLLGWILAAALSAGAAWLLSYPHERTSVALSLGAAALAQAATARAAQAVARRSRPPEK